MTWIVKGTFDLRPGGKLAFAEKQDFPTADEFYPDDGDGAGAPRYESDFAWFKPRADILVVGDCHAPGGRPVTHCRAAVRVGGREKAIAVVGNRRWERRWLAWEATPPEPFVRMPLRYENSFGGEKHAANPIGKGARATEAEDGDPLWPLPNLEDPRQLVTAPRSRPPVAGLGPLSRKWSERHGKIGTYKGAYRKTRWPWFPEDFDWGFMNAAPADLQVDGYLRGDEPVALENLHPRQPLFEFQLPGLRIRSFVHRASPNGATPPTFEEIDLKLDTLWIDMEKEKAVLLWRGWVPTASEEFEDILDCYVATEPLDAPAQPKDWHYRTFRASPAAEVAAFAPEAPPPEPPPASPAPEKPADSEEAKLRGKLEATMARANDLLALDRLSPKGRQYVLDSQAKLMERVSAGPAKAAELGAAYRKEQLSAALTKAGIDPTQPLPEPPAALGPVLQAMGITPELASKEPEIAAGMGAVLGKLADTPEKVAGLLAELAKVREKLGLPEVDATPPPEPPPAPPPALTRESVVARAQAGDSFEGANLSGLDLSGVDLSGLNLAGARLEGTLLRKAKLSGANLTGAFLARSDLAGAELAGVNAAGSDLTSAKLRAADLSGADLAGACLGRADLTGAKLVKAVLEGADMSEATCTGVDAKEALFVRAELRGSQFQDARCDRADFSKAKLEGSSFRSANLTEARFEQTTGGRCDFTAATLAKFRATGSRWPGAVLARAKGPGSIWKGTDLTGADLRFANLPDALFKGANLRGANLSGADLRKGNFCKADLSRAKMRQMNLFQGSLEKAKLSETDLSGSNLYEVEFLDALLDRTVADGANTKMTKLELA